MGMNLHREIIFIKVMNFVKMVIMSKRLKAIQRIFHSVMGGLRIKYMPASLEQIVIVY